MHALTLFTPADTIASGLHALVIAWELNDVAHIPCNIIWVSHVAQMLQEGAAVYTVVQTSSHDGTKHRLPRQC